MRRIVNRSRSYLLRSKRWYVLAAIVAILAVAWETTARALDLRLLPPITKVLEVTTRDLWTPLDPKITPNMDQPLLWHIILTLSRWLACFVVATVVGVGLGFIMGSSRTVRALAWPPANLLRALPSAVLWPLLFPVLRSQHAIQFILVAFGTVWPIALSAMSSVANIPVEGQDTLKVLHTSRFRRSLIRLYWALPGVLAGIEIGCAVAFLLTVTAEILVPVNGGLGWYVNLAREVGQTELPRVYGGACLTALIGWLLNTLVGIPARRFVPSAENCGGSSSKLSKVPPPDIAAQTLAILTADYVTKEIRARSKHLWLNVEYQDTPYLHPNELKMLGVGAGELVQRDISISSMLDGGERQMVLFARSWIVLSRLSPEARAQLRDAKETIGDIFWKNAAVENINLGYRTIVTKKLASAFQAGGAIRLVERLRLLKINGVPAALINEFVAR